jgi:hypothetical protein
LLVSLRAAAPPAQPFQRVDVCIYKPQRWNDGDSFHVILPSQKELIIPQFGLVAEEVEKVNPDLVVRDDEGKVMSVRYEAVNAMLLNEFLKEHRKVEEQAGEIAQMKKQIEALTATVQKVSDQIALCKPAPQLVANP